LVPWLSHRYCLLDNFAPDWLPPLHHQELLWHGHDRDGWVAAWDSPPEGRRRLTEETRNDYNALLSNPALEKTADRALRRMIEGCRQRGIVVVLHVMPESTLFRGWYTPAARALLDGYLAGLARDYGVAVIDARTWMPDARFLDAHHLTPRGAAEFTARFGR